jgi:hypothetical protein
MYGVSARKPIQIRLSDHGIDQLSNVATEWDVTRSDVIRIILGNALGNAALLAKLKPAKTV